HQKKSVTEKFMHQLIWDVTRSQMMGGINLKQKYKGLINLATYKNARLKNSAH
ncbi:3652_t:CDS:1, partial [Funneliformis mosseae]